VEGKLYITVGGEARGELIEKKSRFIGSICSADTEEKALDFIAKISREFYDATHNVWCYIVRDGNKTRFSDAGEPSGTAGRPALEVLTREGVTDVCLVIARYFGGTMLGAGGLVRAYAASAKKALDAAGIIKMAPFIVMELSSDYSDHARLSRLAADFEVAVENTTFLDKVNMTLAAEEEKAGRFADAVRDVTAGRCEPAISEIVMRPKEIERGG